ncbi:MAG: hypothetical protein AAGA90_21085 [Actinomycetota bacterium]
MSGAAPDPDVTARLLRGRLADGPLDLPVSGASMRGVIDSGATVEVRAGGTPRIGEIWAFTADGGDVVVHRVRHVRSDGIVGRGAGNRTDDPPVGHDRLIGLVTAARHDGRTRRFGRVDRIQAAVGFSLRAIARRVRRATERPPSTHSG